MDKIAVLIPCYNEAKTIEKVVTDFRKALPDACIYVYDNNSTDGTADIAQKAGAVVRHEYQQGKGNVVRRMFEDIEAECYLIVDGDDTYPAEVAPEMVHSVLEKRTDMVVGDRLSSTYFQENKRPFHNFGNSLVRFCINRIFKSNIKDIMTGYRAFSYRFVKTFPVISKGFEIETEMSIHAIAMNMAMENVVNDKVYAIPMIFIVGWRGEPGVHDEPQHIYQGEVTIKLLEDMGIKTFILAKETTEEELERVMADFRLVLAEGKDVAFIVRKGAIAYDGKVKYENNNRMLREEIIQHIVKASGDAPIVSTTGKASRELFETREANGQSHKYDFLTVGSMGHSSSIALGVALHKPDTKIWCIDGDGAVLMHMGAMALLGSNKPENMIHVVINNGAHETVGGMPTVAGNIDLVSVALACGYPNAVCVDNFEALDKELEAAKRRSALSFIEVKCSIGARENLGRPTTTALENKCNFMEYLKTL